PAPPRGPSWRCPRRSTGTPAPAGTPPTPGHPSRPSRGPRLHPESRLRSARPPGPGPRCPSSRWGVLKIPTESWSRGGRACSCPLHRDSQHSPARRIVKEAELHHTGEAVDRPDDVSLGVDDLTVLHRRVDVDRISADELVQRPLLLDLGRQIGRASCRESV